MGAIDQHLDTPRLEFADQLPDRQDEGSMARHVIE